MYLQMFLKVYSHKNYSMSIFLFFYFCHFNAFRRVKQRWYASRSWKRRVHSAFRRVE